jgi:hypothetical protein
MRRRDREGAGAEPDERRPAPEPAAPAVSKVIALQQSAGNHAVAGLLARHGGHDHAPEEGGGTATAPAALTQAGQEAEASATVGLLRDAHRAMATHANLRVRNTAALLDPPGERPEGRRMRVTPMTLRADSNQLVAENDGNPAEDAYYFYGLRQDNQHEHGPNTLGTIDGDTVVIRGRMPGGAMRDQASFMRTLVHECSHILVADYGQHPGTSTDAASFDRYKDEFRAYFITPFDLGAIANEDTRADRIRDHLVGTSATEGGYPDLRAAYWAEPHATNAFRRQVDGHRRPDGFNIDNSALLDRLVHLLRDQQAGRATADDTIFQITILSPAERAEAARATLIAGLVNRLPAADALRIRRALTAPASVGYGREINPTESPHVTALLDAITTREPDQIVDAYRRCPATDRGALERNAHLLAWVRRALPNEQLLRTCVTCMVYGRSWVYFDRVRVLVQACGAAAGATEMPEALRSALRGLSFEVRLAFYRLCEDSYRAAVEPLAEPLRSQVRAILRGEREP